MPFLDLHAKLSKTKLTV